MSILVLNVGSSSLKFALFARQTNLRILGGKIDHSRDSEQELTIEIAPSQENLSEKISANQNRIEHLLQWLEEREFLASIKIVAHRIVHGGDEITEPTLVNAATQEKLHELVSLAPLHMPAALQAIEEIQQRLPKLQQAVVVDTAFFQTLPPAAAVMPLPYELYTKYGIRKFGFHGISHQYCCHRSRDLLKAFNRPDRRIIVCHIGSGCSVTAIDGQQPVDTSMGFTPLDGLMMATRSGAIDPGVLVYLQKHLGWNIDRIDQMLHHESGLLGVSQQSSDFRQLLECHENDANSALAIRMFIDRIRQKIGGLAVQMSGLDGLVFTAGIGENSARLRQWVCEGLQCMGVQLDPKANDVAVNDGFIHSSKSSVSVLRIKTQEEAWIARQIQAKFIQPSKSN